MVSVSYYLQHLLIVQHIAPVWWQWYMTHAGMNRPDNFHLSHVIQKSKSPLYHRAENPCHIPQDCVESLKFVAALATPSVLKQMFCSIPTSPVHRSCTLCYDLLFNFRVCTNQMWNAEEERVSLHLCWPFLLLPHVKWYFPH